MHLSGEQIAIAFGPQRAVVASVGATLRSYFVADRPVLDGFDADEVCPDARGQILAPWPNRVADGRYVFEGRCHQLPIDEPEKGHAIHGLSRWAAFRVEHRSGCAARFHHRLHARPGYPFPLDLVVEYRLSDAGLAVALGATNVGSRACPLGLGAHPYLSFAPTHIDDVELRFGAEEWLETDDRSIPVRPRPVEGSALDFHGGRTLGATALDTAFSRLERDLDGVASVLLRHRDRHTRLWFDRGFEFVQIYTGDAASDPARRRTSLAVEPMSCAPNAFNSGHGLRVLAPGESLEGRWGISVW